MSKTVDQRVVEMRFDNAQFERGIAQSMNSINNLKESLDFSKLSTSGLDGLSKDIGNISTSVDSIADKFSVLGIAGMTAISKISGAAIDLGLSIKDNLIKNMEVGYDKYNIMMESIQTIMYGTRDMIGEGLKWATQEDQMDFVTSQIEKLNWYTDETSYNLTDMTNNVGKFVAAGVDLEDATTAMMGISSWAAMSGQNAEAASRAMYNLSQALAIGKVTVADWKSIELANMATTEFKHTVADIAFEMGKLHETEEGWYAAYDSKGKEVLVAYDGMRQSLAAGWFDNDVLTAVLKKYGDFANDLYDSVDKTGLTATELLRYSSMYKDALSNGEDMTKWVIDLANKDNIYNYTEFGECLEKLTSEYNELGRQSFMAGQECKTFKDVMLATEDAATSAWMGIYQAIFGNYLQSKELWSSMAEEFYELFVEGIAVKRNLLQRWNDIGGRDHLINALWNIWYNIKDVMNAFTEAFGKLFPEKNAVQLLSYAVAFERWTEALRFSDWGWVDQIRRVDEIAENVAETFRHISDFFLAFGNAAAKAWNLIFPPSSDQLWQIENDILDGIIDITSGFERFTSTLVFTDEQSKKLERTFAGLFAIIDMGRMFIATLLEPLTGIEVEFIDIKDPILDVTAAIGDWLVAWRNWIKEHEYFKILISWIMDFVSKIPGKVDALLKDLFGIGLQDVWEMIKTGAYYAAGAVYLLFTNLPKWANEATQLLFGTDLKGFWEMLKGWVVDTFEHVKEFFSGTTEKAGQLTKSKVFTLLLGFWEKLKEFVVTSKITIWDFCTGIPGYINLASKLLFKTDLHTFWENFLGWISSVGESVNKLFTELIPEKVNDLCKYITGSDLHELWDKFKIKVENVGVAIKEFFENIPQKVKDVKEAFYNSKIYDFWTKFKIKVQEVWENTKDFFTHLPEYANDLSIKLFGTDIETWWNNLCTSVVTTFINTKEFLTTLPDRVNQTTQKLFKSDFPTFWENTRTNAQNAWSNIVGFFDSIPEKADSATQALFGTDFGTWWENAKAWVSETKDNVQQFFDDLPGNIDKAKAKFNEIKTAVEKFFSEDLPAKLDEISQSLFNTDFATACNNFVGAIETIKQAFKDFFGIGEEYNQEETITIPFMGKDFTYTYVKNKSGVQKIKDFIDNLMEDLGDAFSSWDSFKETDAYAFIRNLGIVGAVFAAIAGAIFGLVKVLEAIKGVKEAFKTVDNVIDQGAEQGFWGNFLGGFLNPFKEVAETAGKAGKSVAKFVTIKMIIDGVLEIAAALAILAMLKPERLWPAFGALAALFGSITAMALYLMSDKGVELTEKVDVNKMLKIASFFDMMGGVMIAIGTAILIAGQVDSGKIMESALAIGALFGAIVGALETIAYTRVADVDFNSLMILAKAIGGMSLAMVAIAGALWIAGQVPVGNLEASAIAVSSLFGAITGVIVLFSYMGVDAKADQMMTLAKAIGAMSLAMLVISVSLLLIGDIPADNLLSSTEALLVIFGAIAGAIALFSILDINADSMIKIGGAMLLMGVALVAISIAFATMQALSPDQIAAVTFALITLMTAMSGIFIGLTYAGAAIPVMLAFGGAILLIGAGAAMAGLGLLMVALAFEKFFNLNPKGMANVINGIKSFFDILPQMATKVGEAIIAFCQVLLDNAETIKATALMLAEVILAVIQLFVPQIISIVVAGIFQFLEEIQSTILPLMEFIGSFLDQLLAFLLTYVPQITETVLILIQDTLTRIANHIGEITEQLTRILIEILLGTIDGITAEIPHIIESVWNFWITLINSFADGLDAHAKELKDALQHLWESCIQAAKTFFGIGESEPEFLKIAKDVINGFIKGITDFAGGAITAIQNFGTDITNGLKSILGIASPSKVFAELGRYVDEGFAKGVDDYADVAIASTEDMAQGSIDAVSGAIASISDIVNGEMDSDPIIKPILDLTDVTNGASMIGGMFGDQSMALAMSANSSLSENATSQSALYSAFEDLKTTLNNFGKSRNGVTNNNVFNITGNDPREIANAVSEILQQDVERTGAVWGS